MTEKYNPWTVVNVIFKHLVDEGLHPVLGESGDPSRPAAELLAALGVTPGSPVVGDGHLAEGFRDELATIRSHFTPVEPDDRHGGSGTP